MIASGIGFDISLAAAIAEEQQEPDQPEVVVTGEGVPRSATGTPSSLVVLTELRLEGKPSADHQVFIIVNRPGTGQSSVCVTGLPGA